MSPPVPTAGGRARLRIALAAVLSAAICLPAVPLLDLPDPSAVHWSASGRPDGSASRWLVAGAPLTLWAAVCWSTLRRGPRPSGARAAYGVGGLLAAVQLLVVAANAGAPSWREARHLALPWLFLPLAAGLTMAWIGGRLAPAVARRHEVDVPEVAQPEPGERLVWAGRAVNPAGAAVPLLLLVPLLGPVLGGAEGPSGPLGMAAPAMVLLVLAALFSSVRVVVGPSGVVAGLGPWGWPRRRIAMPDIRRARAEIIEPMDVGGWGYRLGRNGPVIVIRGGEALVLELVAGGRLTVTVDDAGEAAAVVNAYAAMS